LQQNHYGDFKRKNRLASFASGSVVNRKTPEPLLVGVPITVQSVGDNNRSVLDSTVKVALVWLVKENWNAPLGSSIGPVNIGGIAPPSGETLAGRLAWVKVS